MPEVKRYECYEYEDLYGPYVLYTDAVKMQREAFKKGWLSNHMERPGDKESEVVAWAEKRAKEEYPDE